MEENTHRHLCTKCVQDKTFNAWVRANGVIGKCEFVNAHGSRRKVVSVGAFAERAVDPFLRENYQIGSEEMYVTEYYDNPQYRMRGESLLDVVMNELGSDDDAVVQAIIENLPDVSHRDIAQGADPFYDDTQLYERTADVKAREDADREEYWYENRFRLQWGEFCAKVQYERRFFKTKELLDELFGDPATFESEKNDPVYMLEAGQKIFRARLLDGAFTYDVLKSNPASELGPPPRARTYAGRMNVEYIPAFYGAFSEETAVAEIRPGIGEEVAIGEFRLQHGAKVFDFTSFSRTTGDYSHKNYAHTRYDFIKQMEDEISKRVLPFDKQREYIATQIVAEYLREYFDCDAVIYRSSMIADRNADSRNVVFLPKGLPFIGAPDSALVFERFRIKEVRKVTYDLFEHPF